MGQKRTPAQEKILAALRDCPEAVSAQHLHRYLRDRHQNFGLATIYRALDRLKVQGMVQGLPLPNGETVYSARMHNLHHLTCLQCGTSFPLEECPLHGLGNHLTEALQFEIYYHTLEFFGLCDRCRSSGAAPS
jgi:Fur family ferric uptake transcriptional regulator